MRAEQAMCVVLDQGGIPVGLNQLCQSVDIGGPAGVVNGNYCACRRVDERTYRIRINAQTHGVDIGKSEFGTRPSERTRSGHKGVRRHDYVGPRLHVEDHR